MKSQLVNYHRHLNDGNIFYQQGGAKSNSPPIVFLQGWGISTKPYQEVLTFLAQQHPLIAPALPSFARSSYPKLRSSKC